MADFSNIISVGGVKQNIVEPVLNKYFNLLRDLALYSKTYYIVF